MDSPNSWEHELFGSSPTTSSVDGGDDHVDEYSVHTPSTAVGESSSSHQVSCNVVPPPFVDTNCDNINNVELGPQTGMLYPDLQSLFKAYQEHAKLKGFSVTKRTTRKSGPAGYKYCVMVCDRARLTVAHKTSKRVGCKARVNSRRQDDGSWIVGKTVYEHNHELCPTMSILMPAHRTMSIHLKRQLEANDIAGIRVCKNVRLAEVQAGGPQNLGCLPKDCRNFVDERRRLRLGIGDAEAIRKLFLRLQHKERDFFHLMDIGDNGRLRNVLWIHPRCKAAYEDFHDVISFDTTYLVNRYKMPFATVVGINHHGQSILLGCALVTHEDADSFRWLFSNWLEAMGNVQPTCIITDQCESIRIAIMELMPNTIHRFCLWHILSKLPVKFKGIPNYHSAAKEFKGIIYDSLTIEIFETGWANFLVKYHVEGNEWLRTLYNERESWVPVYLNHIFWGGMTSTQRSEGMHAYFDEYINYRSTLKQFVEQYEIATVDKIQKEFLADYDCKSKVIKCVTHFPWERQIRDAYTNNMFKKVQDEINRMFYCHTVVEVQNDSETTEYVKKFKVTESLFLNEHFVKDVTYVVTHKPSGEYFECNCRLFQFKGIQCCHIFRLMTKQNVQYLNPRYLLHRWRKDVYRRHSSIFFAGGYPHMTEEYKKFQEVERHFQECTDAAVGSAQKMEYIKQKCIALRNELLNWHPNAPGDSLSVSARPTPSSSLGGTPIMNPDVARPCGRPRGNRIPSGFEGRRSGRGSRGRRGRGNAHAGRINQEPANGGTGSRTIDLNAPVSTMNGDHFS